MLSRNGMDCHDWDEAMSELKRCFKCGLIQCETCGGFGVVDLPPPGIHPCKACGGTGWREVEQQYPLEEVPKGASRDALGFLHGLDPKVLCPGCKPNLVVKCCQCKKERQTLHGEEVWVESLAEYKAGEVSHTYCPNCAAEVHKEIDNLEGKI